MPGYFAYVGLSQPQPRRRGRHLRDQVAVRAIFTALFKDQYELPILPKNIAQKLGPSATITQLELNDGWIGLSVDKTENLTPQRVTELEAPKQRGRKQN